MECILIRVLPVMFFLFFSMDRSEKLEVKRALVQFMGKLSSENVQRDENWGWNMSTDPCTDHWRGVSCDTRQQSVRKIVLERYNFSGVLDASSLCMTTSLVVLSLNGNSVNGEIPAEISNCRHLTHLYLSWNRFSGNLPGSLSRLGNLKRLDISNNDFSGDLPDMSRVSGLLTFLAQNNQLSGGLPKFDFANLLQFNVSNNNLSGRIPDVNGYFNVSSFLGNPELCGPPFPNTCPNPPLDEKGSKSSSKNRILIFSGYILLGVVVVLLLAFKFCKKIMPKGEKTHAVNTEVEVDDCNSSKTSGNSSEIKTRRDRSEYSITSVESGMVSSSLVVLTSPVVNELRFEDLLRAPAELVGRGKHGSLYKVILNGEMSLAVKRIRDWGISNEDFKKRMQRIDQVKHTRVLPVVAYYCSKQEKLLVYEYQQNGSLFNLLHGTQNGQLFDWGSRLSIAAGIAEGLAFMHEELRSDGIAHGNLKSSNIVLNKAMEPCISEYGLMVVENHQGQPFLAQSKSSKDCDAEDGRAYSTFTVDIYGFGVILLELLTGKLVQNSGAELARWVHSVVREEWTVEVFDKALLSEGASEERMVNLLQVALKCINPSPSARPSINQVALMIYSIKEEEEEERSISSDP